MINCCCCFYVFDMCRFWEQLISITCIIFHLCIWQFTIYHSFSGHIKSMGFDEQYMTLAVDYWSSKLFCGCSCTYVLKMLHIDDVKCLSCEINHFLVLYTWMVDYCGLDFRLMGKRMLCTGTNGPGPKSTSYMKECNWVWSRPKSLYQSNIFQRWPVIIKHGQIQVNGPRSGVVLFDFFCFLLKQKQFCHS